MGITELSEKRGQDIGINQTPDQCRELVQTEGRQPEINMLIDTNSMVEIPMLQSIPVQSELADYIRLNVMGKEPLDRTTASWLEVSLHRQRMSWRRRHSNSPHRDYYVELPVEPENSLKRDHTTASPTGLSPLVKQVMIKRKHDE